MLIERSAKLKEAWRSGDNPIRLPNAEFAMRKLRIFVLLIRNQSRRKKSAADTDMPRAYMIAVFTMK
jgi:hypothetical protein